MCTFTLELKILNLVDEIHDHCVSLLNSTQFAVFFLFLLIFQCSFFGQTDDDDDQCEVLQCSLVF